MRNRILEIILNNKREFVSGESLSKQLGISRTAIWKHINSLKEEGYNIESINKKGYRLIENPSDILTNTNILHRLKTEFIGKEIIHFSSIDSTNEYTKSIGKEEKDGVVVISEEQTKGKGRLGRQWHSSLGEGIWMSILLKPDILPYKTPFITLVAGASMVKALNDLGVKAFIKWPNDIIINNKKVAGVLTELSAEIERVNYVVLGIGINVKTMNFSKEIETIATSLYKEGYNVSRLDIVIRLLENFESLYTQYINHNTKKEVLDICREYSAIIGQNIYTIQNGEKQLVTCLDINEEGNLIVKDINGKVKEIMSGEVSIRGVKGYV